MCKQRADRCGGFGPTFPNADWLEQLSLFESTGKVSKKLEQELVNEKTVQQQLSRFRKKALKEGEEEEATLL